MKIKIIDIVSLASAFAAIIATVVAIVTLNQNSMQLEYSINPDLIIKDLESSLFIYKDHKAVNVPFHLVTEAPANDTVWGKSKEPDFNFQIINVGRGTARHAELNWEFDLDYFNNHSFVKNDSLKVYQQAENRVIFYESTMHSTEGLDFVDYILPIDQEKTETTKRYPNLYLFSWSNILHKIIESDKLPYGMDNKVSQTFN